MMSNPLTINIPTSKAPLQSLSLLTLLEMCPDGTSSSPGALPESAMDMATTGTPREMPVPRVKTRGRRQGGDPQATASGHVLYWSSSVLQKGNTE